VVAYEITFGGNERDSLRLTLGRTDNRDQEPYRWVDVEVWVGVGLFEGAATVSLLFRELTPFERELTALYETLAGTAKLDTLEGQIGLILKGDGKGHVAVAGHLGDRAGDPAAKLTFDITIDQTFIPAATATLRRFISDHE
jgi:hypothetical protein